MSFDTLLQDGYPSVRRGRFVQGLKLHRGHAGPLRFDNMSVPAHRFAGVVMGSEKDRAELIGQREVSKFHIF